MDYQHSINSRVNRHWANYMKLSDIRHQATRVCGPSKERDPRRIRVTSSLFCWYTSVRHKEGTRQTHRADGDNMQGHESQDRTGKDWTERGAPLNRDLYMHRLAPAQVWQNPALEKSCSGFCRSAILTDRGALSSQRKQGSLQPLWTFILYSLNSTPAHVTDFPNKAYK